MNYEQGAHEIMRTLIDLGYEAYIVGGYVRNFVLGITGTDIDIATNAIPEVVKGLFPKTILTGLKHGTVTVVLSGKHYEVTTFRTDGKYLDNRRPETVEFVSDLKTDVLRRDFTMNALALNLDGKVIDYVDGVNDIRKKVIRTVGDPGQRFSEDALRMLRVFRFVAQLGFSVDSETLQALKNQRQLIANIARERILMELEKLVFGKDVLKALQLMAETDFYDTLAFWREGIPVMLKTGFKPKDLTEFLTCCAVASNLDTVTNLPISNIMKKTITDVYNMYSVGITEFTNPLLFRNGLRIALLVNKLNVHLRSLPNQSEAIKAQYERLPIKRVCDLQFKGSDLITLYPERQGPWIGDMIDEIILAILTGRLDNDYAAIKSFVEAKVFTN